MKQTYRAPLSVGSVVQESFLKGKQSELSKPLSTGEPLSLDDIRKVYRGCLDGQDQYGGIEGLRWSRRILKQEGMLKSLNTGNVSLPQLIDLQLGPSMFVGITDLDIEKASSLMMEEEIISCCVPLEKGTAVFFPAYYLKGQTLVASLLPFEKLNMEAAVFVDENRDRLKAIVKSSGSQDLRMDCFKIGDPEVITCGDKFQEFYYVKVEDRFCGGFVKVDKKLGIVFGWGVVATENGEKYFDTQGDHIPDDSVLEASAEYMLTSRVAGDQHIKDDNNQLVHKGTVVFAWPMTKDIAEAFGFPTTKTGLLVGLKPDDPEILTKFETGEYTGFSIGGFRIREFTEEVQ